MTFDLNTATPMMVQWHQCRKKANGALLLFRMGDFYEAFYEDAVILAKALDLTLTKRQDIPMSGIPYHAFQNYIDRILDQGLKVAVAEQTEDPKKAKGLVKRDVVRIITPGTLIDSNLLKAKANNYIASVCQIGAQYGIAFLDITTADFKVLECSSPKSMAEAIYSARPTEIVIPKKFLSHNQDVFEELQLSFKCTITSVDDWQFDPALSVEFLVRHFKVHSLDGFGLKGMNAATNSAGALLNHITDYLCLPIDHITALKKIEEQDYLLLDHITLDHLEITEPQHSQSKDHTLLHHVDKTSTAMGARLMRQWVQKPLLNLEKILARQDAIENLLDEPYCLNHLKKHLSAIYDIERLIMKISTNYAAARDFNALKRSLKVIPAIKEELLTLKASLHTSLFKKLQPLDELVGCIEKALVEEPPAKLGDGSTFKENYHEQLDEYRSINKTSKGWLAQYQSDLRESTQIKTLKVGYNRVFGYYIEVSKGQAHLMPETFHRRQTLTNNERFISEELKTFETKALSAEEKISSIENQLFEELRLKVLTYQKPVMEVASIIAQLDCIASLTLLAEQNHYIKPLIDQSSVLKINHGRHPILDRLCKFIPNNTSLDDENNQLALITGPNMAGKSTYIRQVALLVILAQMGSYIPAESAHIGIVDKIFSRIGASDDLARGQSTFMVEMVETANILNNLSDKSLVILDEIGRGTSTYDGIAIAQSTAEFLLKTKTKTLFATHYSELTKLTEKNNGVVNYTVAVHEDNNKITFLYKIIPGCTDKSYGVHVAELAGLPFKLISRAKEILEDLERNKKQPQKKVNKSQQLSFLPAAQETPHPLIDALKKINPEHLTPIEALTTLQKIKEDFS
ncbi:MAG: DNA mismatch repair protein MutS [Chlamydiae bacterium]|nr:DNA mismatch repair protein MutS [Chlamydiota bacterium]